jgi:hypothetical protein
VNMQKTQIMKPVASTPQMRTMVSTTVRLLIPAPTPRLPGNRERSA